MASEDQETKPERYEPIQRESALKRARKAGGIPVPDCDDLYIDDAFSVEMQSGTLPHGWGPD